jgi:hypothetical protein
MSQKGLFHRAGVVFAGPIQPHANGQRSSNGDL